MQGKKVVHLRRYILNMGLFAFVMRSWLGVAAGSTKAKSNSALLVAST